MIDPEKSTQKTPAPLQEESSQGTRSRAPFPPLGDTVNQTPTANLTLSEEKLDEAPRPSGQETDAPSHHSHSTSNQPCLMQPEKGEVAQTGKEEAKPSL